MIILPILVLSEVLNLFANLDNYGINDENRPNFDVRVRRDLYHTSQSLYYNKERNGKIKRDTQNKISEEQNPITYYGFNRSDVHRIPLYRFGNHILYNPYTSTEYFTQNTPLPLPYNEEQDNINKKLDNDEESIMVAGIDKKENSNINKREINKPNAMKLSTYNPYSTIKYYAHNTPLPYNEIYSGAKDRRGDKENNTPSTIETKNNILNTQNQNGYNGGDNSYNSNHYGVTNKQSYNINNGKYINGNYHGAASTLNHTNIYGYNNRNNNSIYNDYGTTSTRGYYYNNYNVITNTTDRQYNYHGVASTPSYFNNNGYNGNNGFNTSTPSYFNNNNGYNGFNTSTPSYFNNNGYNGNNGFNTSTPGYFKNNNNGNNINNGFNTSTPSYFNNNNGYNGFNTSTPGYFNNNNNGYNGNNINNGFNTSTPSYFSNTNTATETLVQGYVLGFSACASGYKRVMMRCVPIANA